MPGDPVWLLLVAVSSSGKTEILASIADLPEVEPAATLTEAALLSGSPRKDRAQGATGGLLSKIGDYGILTLKDFGSVLSMHRESRAATLAALREAYDGSWDRPVGADGGKTLHWYGKLGLGGDDRRRRHHAVMDALGSRFAMYRVDVGDVVCTQAMLFARGQVDRLEEPATASRSAARMVAALRRCESERRVCLPRSARLPASSASPLFREQRAGRSRRLSLTCRGQSPADL